MPELNSSSNAISHLNDLITRGRADRQRMAKMLGNFNKVHLQVRTDLENALGEVARLKKALSASDAEKSRLAKRERELAQEVSMMAAAIDVANREIAESDTMLLDTAAAVNADFRIGETGPAPKMPDVRVTPQAAAAASLQAPPQHKPQQPARHPAAPTAQAERAAALKPAAAAAPDELDASFSELEKMLEVSLSETR